MKRISGKYQWSGEARSLAAIAVIASDHIRIQSDEGDTLNHCLNEAARFGDAIPGLPVDLIFENDGRFIPDDPHFRWPSHKASQRLPEILERNWLTVVIALALVPGFVWLTINKAIPGMSEAAVPLIPDIVISTLSQQTLEILDSTYLDDTQLDTEQQQAVRQQWHQVLNQLSLPGDQFHLKFRSFSAGPNAFALPDGTVIVTDQIVALTNDNPDVLTSVLLHEIGHVHHQHGMKLLTQSVATSVLFAMIFGDIEGIGEVLLGTGGALMQSSFSRNMESEADHYAFQQLTALGMSPELFAEAMERLSQSYKEDESDTHSDKPEWFDYFSSHPNSQERIERARNYSHSP